MIILTFFREKQVKDTPVKQKKKVGKTAKPKKEPKIKGKKRKHHAAKSAIQLGKGENKIAIQPRLFTM